MTADELRARETVPENAGICVAALWHAARGDWHKAHELVQDDEGRAAAWVHAYLHRVEGDIGNAGYWYSRAGRPRAEGPTDAEWNEIAAALLVTNE
jgi:hypothetical protein